jgi:LuxR family maltose regulon positive regulatory protein
VIGPLLETKLHAPRQRAGSILRPRLCERLQQAAQSRLTVVSGPAGFGKTTLLTQWLAELPGPPAADIPSVAWVSLDVRDNDPATFWTYVITSLRNAGAIPMGSSTVGPPTQPYAAALTPLLNELQASPRDIFLILDDYHVIDSGEIHEAIGHLLDNLPAQAHLVLASRSDPPLALPRLRARGELVEVRSADLRFTAVETADYLTGPMGLALSPADVARLAERTEGWAAALQLAGLSLQNRDDPSAVVKQFAGSDRFIVDYLTDEVLTRQTDDVRDFLLATSILERLNGSLCDAVIMGSGSSPGVLELERANLFVVPLDDHRQWYRYHHLFAEVLRAHLRELRPNRVADLHLRAAAWFETNGDAADAVRHALAAHDLDRAAALMEFAIPMVARERREAEFGRWVLALPAEMLKMRPVLAVAFVGSLAQASQFDTVDERLTAIETSLRPHGGPWPARPPAGLVVVDEVGFRAVPATIELYRAALALSRGELASAALHAREAVAMAPPEGGLVRAAAGALGGLASWTAGDLSGAHAAYTESIKGLTSVGYLADVLGCSITVGDIERTNGQLSQSVRTYRHALGLAMNTPEGAPLRGAADMHLGIAGVLLERGDLAGAAAALADSDRLGAANGLPQHPYRSRVVAARLREALGDLDHALELLDEADQLYNGDYSPNVAPVPAVRARLHLRRGELSKAGQWLNDSRLPTADLSYLREYEHITFVRLLLARSQAKKDPATMEEATGLLHRLLKAAEEGKRFGTVIELHVLLALAQQAQEQSPAALESLERAMVLAEPEGYVRVFTDEGPAIASLLKAFLKQRPAADSYARRLLGETAGPVIPSQSGLVEPLSSREMDVLRLLATNLTGPEIARQLHISLNTLRTHSRTVFRKLQVNSRRAAVRRATDLNLLRAG